MRGPWLAVLALAIPLLGGCSGTDTVPTHSAEEQKALNELKTLTPEQQIDRIQKGPMPQGAKDAMIREIKTKNGLK